MYSILLIVLALSLGGVKVGSCTPSRSEEVQEVSGIESAEIGSYDPSRDQEVPIDYLEYSGDGHDGMENIKLAHQRIDQIRKLDQMEENKKELDILYAFIGLEPLAKVECFAETDALQTMKTVMAKYPSDMSEMYHNKLDFFVSAIASKYYKECFNYVSDWMGEGVGKDECLSEALGRMEVFGEFTRSFSLEPPAHTLESQANMVYLQENYLTRLKQLIEDEHWEFDLNRFFSRSCGLLRKRLDLVINQGLELLRDAALYGVDLGDHKDLKYFSQHCNFVLCDVTRENLFGNEQSEPELQRPQWTPKPGGCGHQTLL